MNIAKDSALSPQTFHLSALAGDCFFSHPFHNKLLTLGIHLTNGVISVFQDKLGELELQHSNLQELLGVLREQSKGASSQAAGKLMEWHAKLGEMRLKEMRVARNNERWRGREGERGRERERESLA